MNPNNVKVISNPVVLQNLCKMRTKDTDSQGVRIATRKITRCLLYEAAKNLPLVEREVTTPLTTFKAKTIDPNINLIISPILRAGLIFTDEAIDILPQACIRHIGMYRDEETLKPVWYYNKVPMEAPNPEKFYVYITDPMLATGNSLLEAIKLYADIIYPAIYGKKYGPFGKRIAPIVSLTAPAKRETNGPAIMDAIELTKKSNEK